MKTYGAVGALLVTLSCHSPTGVIGGQLAVSATPPIVQLANQSQTPVYFFAIESGLAARADWAPCTDPSHCLALPPMASTDLPYSDIAGYESGAQTAIVYWWHLVPGGATGFRPDSIRAVIVQL